MSHLYVYFHLYFYSFFVDKINFQDFLFIKPLLAIFCLNFNKILNQNSKQMVPHGSHQEFPIGKQIIYGPLLNAIKISTYTFIQDYTFNSFQEIFSPILLFSAIVFISFSRKFPTYTFVRNRRLTLLFQNILSQKNNHFLILPSCLSRY